MYRVAYRGPGDPPQEAQAERQGPRGEAEGCLGREEGASHTPATRAVRIHYSCASLQASKARRKTIFKRAEKYAQEYIAKEKEEVRIKRASRAAGDYYVPAQAKVYFVVRIKG